MTEPRGILRNKSESQKSPSQGELDRQEVIRNTRLNAQLNAESSKGDKIRQKIAEAKDDHKQPDHLKWDEINLYKTEQEKAATMKIDEPKTPYEGGFNPQGEYYQDDEESIPEFSLGEGQFDKEEPEQQPEPEQEPEQQPEPEEEEKPLSAEERHKRFEEMRKSHYHMAGNPLKQKIDVSDDE